MNGPEDEIVIVECKHQHFVGRPVIQKLQGAMLHEKEQHLDKEVKGIVVTSGRFSKEAIDYVKEIGQDIELIDGKKLKNLCEELKIVLLNGKIQIIINKSFRNITEDDSKELSQKNYSKIYWSKSLKPSIKTGLKFIPVVQVKYNVNFDTFTSIGRIDEYSDSGEIIIEGITGKDLNEEVKTFFFSGKIDEEEIKDKFENKKIPFEFTQNDIEEHAINAIMEKHTHDVQYTGNNNRTYIKTCVPKRRDIDIKQFIPVYLPNWTNKINILKMNYKQEILVKGNNHFYNVDELRNCKICEREQEKYETMSICPECGRIVCDRHVKIDYLDKETPICELHAKVMKLWLQKKYFSKKENLKEYKKWWESRNFFQKLYEDKIAFGLSITGVIGLLIFFLSLVN